MEKLLLCAQSNDIYNINKGNVYKMVTGDGDDKQYELHYNRNKIINLSEFQLNMNHFDPILPLEDAITTLTEKLHVEDYDILKYSDCDYDNLYCIRYLTSLIFIVIHNEFSLPCTMNISITHDSLQYGRTPHMLSHYMTKKGIDTICEFIEFICGVVEI